MLGGTERAAPRQGYTSEMLGPRPHMSALDSLKAKIGNEAHLHIEREAEKEVALAMQMPLRDEALQAKYYYPRFLLAELLTELELFETRGLRISPIDLTSLLFRCKLLFATKNEQEFNQRCGGSFRILQDAALAVQYPEKIDGLETIVNRHLAQLEASAKPRIAISPINSFSTSAGQSPRSSFEKMFNEINAPFVCYFEDDSLIEKHEQLEPGSSSLDSAKDFFCAPSIGFKVSGSRNYCLWYATAWLRTFLNLLRIAGFIHPGQRDFGWPDVQMIPPTYPVFVGEHSKGFYKWDEYKWQSWAKIPDGSLFRSFGYRGLSKAWLDNRTLPHIERCLAKHKKIFDCLKNPWNDRVTRDIAPALDILSSATQLPDVGAKILLIYCCLEHFFVPKNAKSENKKYIVGGLNAIAPHLLPWFDRLYSLRCDYAHKGSVTQDDTTMSLIADSMSNSMALLVAKLSVQ
jgi:hypothetical protein